MDISAKTALITGASTGIGFELATLFARDGYTLVLVARKAETLTAVAKDLEQTYQVKVVTIAKDLSEPQAADELTKEIEAKQLSIDVLVNNAGVGIFGDFIENKEQEQVRMMQLNMNTLTLLTKKILPGMIARKSGNILNVASTAAFEPGPGMAVYFATKAFVLSLSEALGEELRGTGVFVTCLCPGPTKTQFDVNAGATTSSLFTGPNVMTARAVAEAAYSGLTEHKQLVVPGFMNRLLIFSLRLTPRAIVPRLVRKILS
jgi:short-subunit dehydrogenase